MKIIAKVIDDNGYKIELIRTLKDIPLKVGMTVSIEITKAQVDMMALFHGLIDEETKDIIFDKFNKANKDKKIDKHDKLSVR